MQDPELLLIGHKKRALANVCASALMTGMDILAKWNLRTIMDLLIIMDPLYDLTAASLPNSRERSEYPRDGSSNWSCPPDR